VTELPDTYETRQGAAMREALSAGDTAAAERIRSHLLAESATSPAEREQLADHMHAMMLFKEQTDALERGDREAAEALAARTRAECSERSIKNALAAGYLQAGLREGLSAERHDQLMAWVGELGMGEEIRALAAGITRL
jgi:hypothetical protein